jgi:hypothetical protein
MDENQPELPPLARLLSDTRPPKRARTRFSSPPLSSDPPIFSSRSSTICDILELDDRLDLSSLFSVNGSCRCYLMNLVLSSIELIGILGDDDPSVDNYTRTRRKRQFRGPWFQQQSTFQGAGMSKLGTPKKKRTFERHYDSGVFLGSDESDHVDMDEAAEELESVTVTARQPTRQWFSNQPTEKDEPSAEALVRQQIERCLENGNESIDLA